MNSVTRSLSICLALVPLTYGCGPVGGSSSEIKERIDVANEPSRLDVPLTFHRNPDFFPVEAVAEKPVWSGNWWPLSAGGTTLAMKKYDLATDNGGRAEAWEQLTVKASGSVSWAGHCNGLAAAGINEERPKHAVEYRGQNFSVADIEALLVEKWQGTNRVQLVGRRCYEGITIDADGRVIKSSCRDINPGALHIVMGNMLGLNKRPLILDISSNEQVWNYPITAYSTKQEVIDRETAISLTNAEGSNYSWDPEAEQFMKVEANLTTATGRILNLHYVLEGKNYEITGGEWIGPSRQDHPDFAWYARIPDVINPYLNVSIIDEIAKLSRE